jgi:serine/threonine-protein phosphatase 4 regulatory subunit 2
MENSDLILHELDEFNVNNDEHKSINPNLENFIEQVAKTGTYAFSWQKIRNLYLHKLKYVLNNIVPSSASHVSTTTTISKKSTSNSTSSSPTSTMLNSKNDAEQQVESTTTTTTTTTTTVATLSSFQTFMQNAALTDLNNVKLIKDRIIERMESFTSAPFTIQRISELLLKPNNHYNRPDKYLRGLEKCIMVVTTIDPSGYKIFVEDFLVTPIKNCIQSVQTSSQNNNNTHAQKSISASNSETNQVDSKQEDSSTSTTVTSPSQILSSSAANAAALDSQQNEMDISTTSSSILTNVSPVAENSLESNSEISENEEPKSEASLLSNTSENEVNGNQLVEENQTMVTDATESNDDDGDVNAKIDIADNTVTAETPENNVTEMKEIPIEVTENPVESIAENIPESIELVESQKLETETVVITTETEMTVETDQINS